VKQYLEFVLRFYDAFNLHGLRCVRRQNDLKSPRDLAETCLRENTERTSSTYLVRTISHNAHAAILLAAAPDGTRTGRRTMTAAPR
jgi:hypothetical protein